MKDFLPGVCLHCEAYFSTQEEEGLPISTVVMDWQQLFPKPKNYAETASTHIDDMHMQMGYSHGHRGGTGLDGATWGSTCTSPGFLYQRKIVHGHCSRSKNFPFQQTQSV